MDTDLMVIRRGCLDTLWQHCQDCPDFNRQFSLHLSNRQAVERKRRRLLSGVDDAGVSGPPVKGRLSLEASDLEAPRVRKPSRSQQSRDRFLQNVPTACQWYRRQTDIVGQAEEYEVIIKSFTRGKAASLPEEHHREPPGPADNLVAVGTTFADLVNSSLQAARRQKSFAYFQLLLFLSYCGLLERRGISYEEIDEVTRRVSSFREKDRKRLRSQALRVNRLINELARSGWTLYRATELFFLNPLSSSALLNLDEEGFRHILQRLTEDDYVRHDASTCLETRYTIPGLMVQMIRSADLTATLSIDDVCTGLGYDSAAVSESVDRICRVWHHARKRAKATVRFVSVIGADFFRGAAASDEGPSALPSLEQERYFNQNSTVHCCRPFDAPIFDHVQRGSVIQTRNLFLSGAASVHDVDPYGLGLLYYAAYYCWRSYGESTALDMCRFLVDAGTPKDWLDDIENRAWETMVDSALMSAALGGGAPRGLVELVAPIAAMYERDLLVDYLEQRRFSRVHLALIGSDKGCSQLRRDLGLLAGRVPIDEPDSRGRTPLAWAVEYGWREAVEVLLEHGADPHWVQPGRGKLSLLHLAVAGPDLSHGYVEIVETLLRYGVDVNVTDGDDWTPLDIAISWNSAPMMQALLSPGAMDVSGYLEMREGALYPFSSGGETERHH